MEQTEFISPFSYTKHDWKVEWKIIASNAKYDIPNENRSEKEEKALEAIASVGVIGGLQLKNLFQLKNLKSMAKRHLIVEHRLKKNNQEIPIYTLGKYGANKIMPEYQSNYWLEMDEAQVLKCISFFQFCQMFNNQSDIEIMPVPEPFTAGIKLNGKLFYVFAEKDGIKELMLFLKWKKHFNESIFILTERLDYVKDINVFLETTPLKIRVILDRQLKNREFKLYHYNSDQGEWKKG